MGPPLNVLRVDLLLLTLVWEVKAFNGEREREERQRERERERERGGGHLSCTMAYQQKLAEKLLILNERGSGVLIRMNYIKKVRKLLRGQTATELENEELYGVSCAQPVVLLSLRERNHPQLPTTAV